MGDEVASRQGHLQPSCFGFVSPMDPSGSSSRCQYDPVAWRWRNALPEDCVRDWSHLFIFPSRSPEDRDLGTRHYRRHDQDEHLPPQDQDTT